MSRIFKSLRLQVEKTLGNLKPRLPIASDGEIRCSTLHCRGRIKGRDMPVGWFNTAGAAPFTSPGTVRSPWVEVEPGSRSLRGRTRADASRAATRILRCAPVLATRTCKAPATTTADRLVESLISLLVAGTIPWRREWDVSPEQGF